MHFFPNIKTLKWRVYILQKKYNKNILKYLQYLTHYPCNQLVFFHRSFVIKWQWQADSRANENIKPPLGLLKKPPVLKLE